MSECESISISIPNFLKDKMDQELKEKKQYNNNKSAIIQESLIKRYTSEKTTDQKMLCILLICIGGGLNIFSIIALSVSYSVTGILFGIGSLTMIFGAVKARKLKWT